MIRSCQIGGDPDKEAFLERDLDIKLVEAQEDGIKILSVTPFTISRAWSCKKKKYVSTLAFIIICENESIEEEKLCTEPAEHSYSIVDNTKVKEYDKDHIWWNGRQFISLNRVSEMKREWLARKSEGDK